MKAMMLLTLLAGLFSHNTYAGPKEDFVKVIKTQCGKSDADAAALATPGRTGNVMKLKTCTSDSIDIGGCTVSCKDASASIGG